MFKICQSKIIDIWPMKLVKILSSLTLDEFKELKLFLLSPYFNSDPNLVKFYGIISKQFPIADSSALFNKNKLFALVFPDHDWNDGKWRNLITKMVKALEQFLVVQEMKIGEELVGRKFLADAYSRRNLYPLFEREAKSLETELAAITSIDQNALLDRMKISQSLYYHPLTNKVDNIQFLVSAKRDAADFFQTLQLKMACEELVHGHILKGHQETREVKSLPPVYHRLYQLVHAFLKDGTETSFQIAKSYFESVLDKLSMGDKKFGLLNLINFAIHQNNLGQSKYQETMLELYKQGLEQKILLENDLMIETTFTNIIATSTSLGEFEWAENFIGKYEQYLQEDIREEAKTLGLANIYFQQSDFSKVIDLLIYFNSKNLTRSFIAKSMLLRSYFDFFIKDRSYYDLFNNFSQSFESQVKRKVRLPEERRIGCINLSTTLRKITKAILEQRWNSDTKSSFQAMVANMNPLIGKPWLEEKLKKM